METHIPKSWGHDPFHCHWCSVLWAQVHFQTLDNIKWS